MEHKNNNADEEPSSKKLTLKDDCETARSLFQMNNQAVSTLTLSPKKIIIVKHDSKMYLKKKLTMVREEEPSFLGGNEQEEEDAVQKKKKLSNAFDIRPFEIKDDARVEESLSRQSSNRQNANEEILEVKEEESVESKNEHLSCPNNKLDSNKEVSQDKIISVKSSKNVGNIASAQVHSKINIENSKKSSEEKKEKSSSSEFQDYLKKKENNLKLKSLMTRVIPPKSPWKKVKNFVKKILHSKAFSIILTCAIIFILFIEDIKELLIPKEYDYWIEMSILVVYCFLVFEFILFCAFIRSYRFSFFFFVDLLSIAGLTLTIDFLYHDPLHAPNYVLEDSVSGFFSGFLFNSHLSKTSRASVNGIKLGRTLTFLKTLNVFNLGKIYKHNLDRIMDKNQELIIQRRQEEMLKISRRRPILYTSLQDKIEFFRQFHKALQTNSRSRLVNSQLNPKIIERFYDYAVANEKKNIACSVRGDETQCGKSTMRSNVRNTEGTSSDGEKRKSFDDSTIRPRSKISEIGTITPRKRQSVFLSSSKFGQNNMITFERKTANEDPDFDDIMNKQCNENRRNTVTITKICYCEESISKSGTPSKTLKGQRRFSLISGQILTKIGEKLDGGSNMKGFPSNEENLNTNEIKPPLIFKGLDIMLDRRHSIGSSVANSSSKQNSFILCEKCGGLIVASSFVNESFHTYINEDIDYHFSRRSSYFSENENVGINGSNKQESSSYSTPKKHTQDMIVNKLGNDNFSSGGNVSNNLKESNSVNEKEQEEPEESNKMQGISSFLQLISKNRKTKVQRQVTVDSQMLLSNPECISSRSENESEPLKKTEENQNKELETDFKKIVQTTGTEKDTLLQNKTTNTIAPSFNPRFFQEEKNEYKFQKYHPKLALKLSKVTTEKVVFVVLFLLFSMPFFDPDNYTDTAGLNQYGFEVDYLSNFLLAKDIESFKSMLESMVLNETNRKRNMPYVIEIGLANSPGINRDLISCYVNLTNQTIIFENHTLYKHTRYTDRVFISNDILYLVYDIEKINLLQATLNIVKTFFIVIILWMGAFVFLRDIHCLVVAPLETSFRRIRNSKIEIENMHHDIDDIVKQDIEKLPNSEVYLIEYFFRTVNKMIIRSIGIRSFNYFKSRIFAEAEMNKFTEKPFCQITGAIMVIEIGNLFDCNSHEQAVEVFSKIIEIVDLTVFELFGELIKIDTIGYKIIVLWDEYNPKNDEITESSTKIEREDLQTHSEEYKKDHMQEASSHESYNINETYKSSASVCKDMFHSYEVGDTNSKKLPPKFKESDLDYLLLSKLTNFKFSIKNISNFALISAVKILARCYYSQFISNRMKKKLDIKLAIHKGKINSLIIDSSFRIENAVNGYDLQKALEINKLAFDKRFDIQILFSEKIYQELDETFRKFNREVAEIEFQEEHDAKKSTLRLFTYDISYNKSSAMNPYLEKKLFLSCESSLVIRREFADMINDGTFDIMKVIKNDPELRYVRSSDSSSFIRIFQQGYLHYKNKNFPKAKSKFKTAILFRPTDKITISLIKELEEVLDKKG